MMKDALFFSNKFMLEDHQIRCSILLYNTLVSDLLSSGCVGNILDMSRREIAFV